MACAHGNEWEKAAAIFEQAVSERASQGRPFRPSFCNIFTIDLLALSSVLFFFVDGLLFRWCAR